MVERRRALAKTPTEEESAGEDCEQDEGRGEGRRETGSPARRGEQGRSAGGRRKLGEMEPEGLEVLGEVLRRGVTLLGLFGETPLQDPAKTGGTCRRERGNRLGILTNNCGQCL